MVPLCARTLALPAQEQCYCSATTHYLSIQGVLVAVVISTLLTYTLRLDKEGVKVLGPISSSFPTYDPSVLFGSPITEPLLL